ncbi:MAG: glycosyltransferase family 2 protein [bacterium]
MDKLKIIAVLPAYNAEKTLEKTLSDIPPGSVDEIILVDDCSTDKTVQIARHKGLTVFTHSSNQGYGANQKTCYTEALKKGADIVVMIHPDYQYDSKLTSYLAGLIKNDVCDIMLGSRIRTRKEALRCGMPLYKYIANRFLTMNENIILGENISEYHTGFRAYSRKVLETIPWQKNSNSFTFDAQFLIQASYFKFRIGSIPVPARYFKEASSINFMSSLVYGINIWICLIQYILHLTKLRKCHLFINQ